MQQREADHAARREEKQRLKRLRNNPYPASGYSIPAAAYQVPIVTAPAPVIAQRNPRKDAVAVTPHQSGTGTNFQSENQPWSHQQPRRDISPAPSPQYQNVPYQKIHKEDEFSDESDSVFDDDSESDLGIPGRDVVQPPSPPRNFKATTLQALPIAHEDDLSEVDLGDPYSASPQHPSNIIQYLVPETGHLVPKIKTPVIPHRKSRIEEVRTFPQRSDTGTSQQSHQLRQNANNIPSPHNSGPRHQEREFSEFGEDSDLDLATPVSQSLLTPLARPTPRTHSASSHDNDVDFRDFDLNSPSPLFSSSSPVSPSLSPIAKPRTKSHPGLSSHQDDFYQKNLPFAVPASRTPVSQLPTTIARPSSGIESASPSDQEIFNDLFLEDPPSPVSNATPVRQSPTPKARNRQGIQSPSPSHHGFNDLYQGGSSSPIFASPTPVSQLPSQNVMPTQRARPASPSHQDQSQHGHLYPEEPLSPLPFSPAQLSQSPNHHTGAPQSPPPYSPISQELERRHLEDRKLTKEGHLNYDPSLNYNGTPNPDIYHPQSPGTRLMAQPSSPPPYEQAVDLQLFDDKQNVRDPSYRTQTGRIKLQKQDAVWRRPTEFELENSV